MNERAGLWEFPSLAADEGVSAAERTAALNAYLARLVGCWGSLRDPQHPTRLPPTCVLEDSYAGELVHVFSHIRMTIRVRRLIVAAPVRASPVRGARCASTVLGACGRPVMWATTWWMLLRCICMLRCILARHWPCFI